MRLHHVELFGPWDEIGLGEWIERDGWVDVEAVDRRVGIGLELLDCGRAIGLHDGGVDVHLAWIVGKARLAQPVLGLRVVGVR